MYNVGMAANKAPKELLRRVAKLERERTHLLERIGHRTYNWRPRVAKVEKQLAKLRQELARYEGDRGR